MPKEMTLVSVGIDVGTTTTQLVISRLTLVNVMPGSQIPKVEICRKSIIYRGKVHFTPFKDQENVDGGALRSIIAKEYEKAGINPQQIDTGAIIITGETAKKENASEIIHSLADYSGDFVVATAGPDLESVLAGKGSGAQEVSKHLHVCLANIDIGGGTTNIAYFDRGKCIGTACVNVGGRLFQVDPLTHRITNISSPGQTMLNHSCPNQSLTQDEDQIAMIRRCLQDMAECVERVVFRQPLLEQDKTLVMTNTLPNVLLDGVIFSGGVAKYIYLPGCSEWWIHGDVGPLLAEEFRKSRIFSELKVYEGAETIHATVLGAGAHTVNVSGSTITVSQKVLPLRNVPAIYPKIGTSGLYSWQKAAEDYNDSLYRTVALVVPSLPNTDFSTVVTLAENLARELPLIKGEPKVIIAQQDIAKVLGQTLLRLLPSVLLVCLDGIELAPGDFLDIARPLLHEDAVPVIVKTLVFAH